MECATPTTDATLDCIRFLRMGACFANATEAHPTQRPLRSRHFLCPRRQVSFTSRPCSFHTKVARGMHKMPFTLRRDMAYSRLDPPIFPDRHSVSKRSPVVDPDTRPHAEVTTAVLQIYLCGGGLALLFCRERPTTWPELHFSFGKNFLKCTNIPLQLCLAWQNPCRT